MSQMYPPDATKTCSTSEADRLAADYAGRFAVDSAGYRKPTDVRAANIRMIKRKKV